MQTLCFIFSVVFFSFSLHAQTDRVENGTSVPASDPLAQSVAFLKMSGSRCSASFITSKVLITAGHCSEKVAPVTTTVEVRDPSGKVYSRKVSQVFTHPKFNIVTPSTGIHVNYDLGLVFIEDEFPFPVRPLKISNVSDLRA